MSAIIEDVQKQDPGSGLVHLYEIELTSSTSIYFHTGLEADLTTVQFRDKTTTSTIRTYSALPIQMQGFKRATTGALPRPKMTIANVLTTFGDALGTLTNDDLLGNKMTRRSTLIKYLYGQASDQNPPIEFPSEIWYIDRIHTETAASITFELAASHDLIGITLPGRHGMANACSWIYKGSSYDKDEVDRVGGCTVDVQGRLFLNNATYKNWVNVDDERVVVSTTTFTAYAGISSVTTLTLNGYYSTSKTDAIRYNIDGSQTGSQTVTEYWQCKKAVTKATAGTPSDGSAYFNRIRIYTTWADSTTYYGYTDDKLNPYVQYTADSLTKLWKTKHTNLDKTPGETIYWELGDACSKTLTGCAMRYNSEPIVGTGAGAVFSLLNEYTVALASGTLDTGTYTAVAHSATSGSGSGMTLTIGIASGATDSWTIVNSGTGYIVGDTVTYTNQNSQTNSLVLTIWVVTSSSTMTAEAVDRWSLPFGGFPGARRYS